MRHNPVFNGQGNGRAIDACGDASMTVADLTKVGSVIVEQRPAVTDTPLRLKASPRESLRDSADWHCLERILDCHATELARAEARR